MLTITLSHKALEELKMSKLLDCPFCGNKAYDCPDDSYGNGIIGCGQCEPEPLVLYKAGNKQGRDKAIEHWNKRA